MATPEIKVTTFLPATLDTREGAKRLAQIVKDELQEVEKVDIDFQGISFMSRSFADQFHKELNLCDTGVDIVIKNAEFGIIEMLEAVSRTQNSRNKLSKSYSILSFNRLDKLKDYSYTW